MNTTLNYKLLYRRLCLIILDSASLLVASFFAISIRYEFALEAIPDSFLNTILKSIPLNLIVTLVIFYVFKLYHSLWAFAGETELQNILTASVISTISNGIILFIFRESARPVPNSYHFLYGFILTALVLGTRFSYRFIRIKKHRAANKNNQTNVLIIGAGDAGNTIIKEITGSSFSTMNVACIIDDDRSKWGSYIQGVKVEGGRDKIIECVDIHSVDEIFIAIPSASRKTLKDLLDICKETECKLRTLPGLYQLVNGDVSISKLKEVEVEDLLGREPIQVDTDSILGYVQGKVVLVTGGGGSIGSELCRQIAGHNPKKLIIVDIYENNAYEIQQELVRRYPSLDLLVLIASVRNTNRMNSIFQEYKPDIVYHAAAHKHVPLMETSPNEAVKNNVFGTWKTAQAAAMNGTKKFVLISTDKAVNPTNIMGASKRICEMIVQTFNRHYDTDFVAVRFGNVLGSNGSVIPLFRKQIAMGGPVTVTHPDIIRYFMTIPEAVSLVLQAGAYAKGGEIFVLDMGEPVKILDLAKNLIRLSGYKVDEDIEIQFTGLRPGEKLYEEMLMDEEGLQDTANKMIHIGRPIELDEMAFFAQLHKLKEESKNECNDIRPLIHEIVPTYIYNKS